jgi:hypothetical protein
MTSMVKKTFSVYVDDDKVKRARELGFELSTTLERSLDMVLSQEYEDLVMSSKLAVYSERIENLKLAIIESQYRLKTYTSDLDTLVQEKNALIKDYEYTKKVIRINNLTQTLNQTLIMQDYNIEVTLEFAGDIIEELIKINPSFDINVHAERLKIIMNS